jgi:hypothetical protein
VLFIGSARRAIAAASEALFPKNDLGAPDFESADIANRLESLIAAYPPPQKRLVRLLFIFLELGAPLLLGLRFSRFSKLSIDARTELIRRFRASSIYPIRLIGDAVKGVLTMIYMSHPSVLRFMGDTREAGEHPLVQLKKGAHG